MSLAFRNKLDGMVLMRGRTPGGDIVNRWCYEPASGKWSDCPAAEWKSLDPAKPSLVFRPANLKTGGLPSIEHPGTGRRVLLDCHLDEATLGSLKRHHTLHPASLELREREVMSGEPSAFVTQAGVLISPYFAYTPGYWFIPRAEIEAALGSF